MPEGRCSRTSPQKSRKAFLYNGIYVRCATPSPFIRKGGFNEMQRNHVMGKFAIIFLCLIHII